MIVYREMANAFNREISSMLQVNSVLNRRLRLPPITSRFEESKSKTQSGQSTFIPEESVGLPRLDFSPFGWDRTRGFTDANNAKNADNPTFSFSRIYTVLPPIGKTFTPSAPLVERHVIPRAPNNIRHNKRSTRKPRVKTKSNEEIISASNAPVIENAVMTKISVNQSDEENETSSVKTSHNEEVDVLRRASFSVPSSREVPGNSHVDEIFNSINSNSVTVDLCTNDTGKEADCPFPQFSTVPADMRVYSDVYPVSPLSNDKRARNVVEKSRQLLREDNKYRLSYIENGGRQRRNATCAAFDETLKNAVQLLKDVFLRKTMEELCMLW